MLFYWLVLGYVLVINVWGSRFLPHANIAAGVLHVVGFVVVITVIGAMTETKHSAAYVFTEVSNSSGWQSDGISWLVGLLSTVYPFLGYVFHIFRFQSDFLIFLPDTMPPPIWQRSYTIPHDTFRLLC